MQSAECKRQRKRLPISPTPDDGCVAVVLASYARYTGGSQPYAPPCFPLLSPREGLSSAAKHPLSLGRRLTRKVMHPRHSISHFDTLRYGTVRTLIVRSILSRSCSLRPCSQRGSCQGEVRALAKTTPRTSRPLLVVSLETEALLFFFFFLGCSFFRSKRRPMASSVDTKVNEVIDALASLALPPQDTHYCGVQDRKNKIIHFSLVQNHIRSIGIMMENWSNSMKAGTGARLLDEKQAEQLLAWLLAKLRTFEQKLAEKQALYFDILVQGVVRFILLPCFPANTA